MFGEVGYRPASIDAITTVAGCSRISFYQYFSSKEDVFRQLGAQVARQLNASTDLLDPITADASGWASIRAWVERFADVHERYRPIFHSYAEVAERDAQLTDDSTKTAALYIAGIQSRVVAPSLPARELDAVVEIIRVGLARMLDDLAMVTAAGPPSFERTDVLDAFTDVVHRTLFGLLPEVNVHERPGRTIPKRGFGPVVRAAVAQERLAESQLEGRRALRQLLDAAHGVFVDRGYHGTRVSDIVEAAGVSQGAFYRYFKNKEELAHLLAVQAMRDLSTTFVAMPEADRSGSPALRRWLRDYNRATASEMAMIRVWVDAALQDERLTEDSGAVLDWGRRRMLQFLEPRQFGDAEVDALVLLSLVDAFASVERPPALVNGALRIIERGFLGR